VVAVCGDAGGAASLVPVIRRLLAGKTCRVTPLAYLQAVQVLNDAGVGCHALPDDLTEDAAGKLLRDESADLLLSATSVNPLGHEKKFIAAARRLLIPSLAVLDFWSNYRDRFSDAQGQLAFKPDLVAVMDERARQDLLAEGFDSKRLVVTGQPALDGLNEWKSRFTSTRRNALRHHMGVSGTTRLVAFLSQAIEAFYGSDIRAAGHLGYTEQRVFRAVYEALNRIAERHDLKIVVAFRRHPREAAEWIDSFVSDGKARLVATGNSEPRALLVSADLVVGMNTVLLIEACYLGCITVSVQPGLRTTDPLASNHLGLSRAVYDETGIEAALEACLLDTETRRRMKTRLRHFSSDGLAAHRVADLLYKMLERRGAETKKNHRCTPMNTDSGKRRTRNDERRTRNAYVETGH
jgi:hypothetical protein